MKEYVKFQVSIFNTWKEKLLICWFYINSMVIHDTLKKIPVGWKSKKLKLFTYEKIEISCCAKIPLLLSSGYVALLPTCAFLFTLHLKIASGKAPSCVIGSWGFSTAASPSESSQVTLLGAIVLGVSAPQLPRAQHLHTLEMSSQDAPLTFNILLEIVHLFLCHWRRSWKFDPLFPFVACVSC